MSEFPCKFTIEEQATIDSARDILRRAEQAGAKIGPDAPALDAILTGLCFEYGPLERENCGAIFLDAHSRLVDVAHIAQGDLTSVPVYYRELMELALSSRAVNVILWHSHPSGDSTPSDADIRATKAASTILAPFQINLLDHYVLSSGGYTSIGDYIQKRGRKP